MLVVANAANGLLFICKIVFGCKTDQWVPVENFDYMLSLLLDPFCVPSRVSPNCKKDILN